MTERYRELFENSREGLLTLEPPRWRFTTANSAALRMFGASDVSELTAIESRRLWPELQPDGRESTEKAGEMIKTALRDGSCFFEWVYKRIDGAQFPASVLLSKVEVEGKVFLLATVRDISERKNEERAVRAAEHKIRSIIQGSPIPTFIIGPDHRILHWNRALEELSGIRARDVLGTTDQWRAFYPEGPRPCLADLVVDRDSTAIEVCYSDKCRTSSLKDDTYEMVDFFPGLGDGGRWLKFTAALIQGADGEAIGAMEVLEDVTNAKRVEEELRESERRFLDVLYASDDAILLIDDNTFIDCNEATAHMLGCATRERLLQKHPSMLSPPQQPDGRSSHEKAEEMIRLAFDRGFHRFEWVHRRANGEDFPVEVSLTPIVHQGKSLLYCVWRDITERKLADERLREFKTAVEQSVDGIALADPDGCLRFVNQAWAKMHGQPADELVGKHLGVCHTKEQLEAEVTPFNERLLKMGSVKGELGHVRRDGTVFQTWMSATLLKDTCGNPHGLIGIARDITEQKRADEKLRENEARLRAITDSAQDAIIMMDHQGMISFWNPAAEKILGYREEEVIGRNLHEFLAPECYHAAQRAAFPHFQRTGQGDALGKTHELAARRKDGQEIPVALSLSSVEVGGEWHAVGIIRDETDRKTNERELIQAKLAAEAANRAKSEFLANMSHEIRTPMTSILGYADLLAEESVGRTAQEYITVIKRNGEHLLHVINDILDLAKIEADRLQIEPTPCSPVRMVAEVASLMRPQAAAKRLTLKTKMARTLPETVLTDPLRLRQILVNLLGNAIKFTDQGEVCLTVQLEAKGDAPRLVFDVTDTGIGMTAEQIGRLFRPFSQVDGSATRKFGGTGLGLCLSKRLAEALGGGIEVRSEPGKGSGFRVAIDPGSLDAARVVRRAREAILDTTPQTTANRTALHGRILLAEDGQDNQRLISFLLNKAGVDVRVVDNGQLAVEAALNAAAASEPFDLILMDMQMPVLDGYEATRQLRERGCTAPIVALTAHAMAEDSRKCLAAGCTNYLSKPFQTAELLDMAARYVTASKEAESVRSSLADDPDPVKTVLV